MDALQPNPSAYNNHSSQVLQDQTEDRWPLIFAALAPELAESMEMADSPSPHCPCPVHGGTDGFRLFSDYESTGGGICNTCGAFPTGIHLLAWLEHYRESGVYDPTYNVRQDHIRMQSIRDLVAQYVGHGPGRLTHPAISVPRKVVDPDSNNRLRESYLEIFDRAIDGEEEFVLYLQSRGWKENEALSVMPSTNLKFCKSLGYTHEDGRITYHPALIMLIFNQIDGAPKPVGMHRIYLQASKNGLLEKLSLPGVSKTQAKKFLNWDSLIGSSIPFYDETSSTNLISAEGPETAWALRALTGVPVRCLASSNEVKRFVPPANVSHYLIGEDFDRKFAGQIAAKEGAAFASALGVNAKIVSPEIFLLPSDAKGVDWENAYLREPDKAKAVWVNALQGATISIPELIA